MNGRNKGSVCKFLIEKMFILHFDSSLIMCFRYEIIYEILKLIEVNWKMAFVYKNKLKVKMSIVLHIQLFNSMPYSNINFPDIYRRK